MEEFGRGVRLVLGSNMLWPLRLSSRSLLQQSNMQAAVGYSSTRLRMEMLAAWITHER